MTRFSYLILSESKMRVRSLRLFPNIGSKHAAYQTRINIFQLTFVFSFRLQLELGFERLKSPHSQPTLNKMSLMILFETTSFGFSGDEPLLSSFESFLSPDLPSSGLVTSSLVKFGLGFAFLLHGHRKAYESALFTMFFSDWSGVSTTLS